MKDGHQRHSIGNVGENSLCMTVHDTIDPGKPLEHLAVDESLRVALFRSGGRDRGRVLDAVLDQVVRRGDQPGSHVPAHKVDIWLLRVADGDVAVGVDDILLVQDVVGCYEFSFQLDSIGGAWLVAR